MALSLAGVIPFHLFSWVSAQILGLAYDFYKECIYIYLRFINDNFNIQVAVGFLLFCLSTYMFPLSSLDGFCLTYLVFSVETLQ